jgi:hypothetical protein
MVGVMLVTSLMACTVSNREYTLKSAQFGLAWLRRAEHGSQLVPIYEYGSFIEAAQRVAHINKAISNRTDKAILEIVAFETLVTLNLI